MKKIELQFAFLKSRVARRTFVAFITCALLPLATLAYFSYGYITRELEKHEDISLRHMAKSTGMSLFEHLLFLEADLEFIRAQLAPGGDSIASFSRRSVLRAGKEEERFRNVVLTTRDNRVLWSLKPADGVPIPDAAELAHLERGETLVKTTTNGESRVATFIAIGAGEGKLSDKILFGEIRPKYWLGRGADLFSGHNFFIVEEGGRLLLSDFEGNAPLRALESAIEKDANSASIAFESDGVEHLGAYWTLFLRSRFMAPQWFVVITEPRSAIFTPIAEFKRIFIQILFLTIWVIFLFSLTQIRRILVPIEHLIEATRRISTRKFDTKVTIHSKDEFQELGESFNQMAAGLREHTAAMETISDIGVSLASRTESQDLLRIILVGAKRIINADGGALYVATETGDLKLSLLQVDSIHLTKDSPDTPPFPLQNEMSGGDPEGVAAYVAKTQEMVNVAASAFTDDVRERVDAFFDGTGYRPQSMLAVPLKNHEDEVVGVIQLINAKDKHTGKLTVFSPADERMLNSLALETGVALAKNQLMLDFKELFESLVELLVTAIDEKSPYTGDHCRRVPILMDMLMDAAIRTNEGGLKDFSMTEDEKYELKIATLLHDCGKVTTPVHIVDKATKLEKIFDRIHLLDTRTEVLKRDASLNMLREKIVALEAGRLFDEEAARKRLASFLRQLDADKEILRTSNAGTEYMPPAMQAQVREIAERYRWVNADGEEEPFLSEDEVRNLTVQKGTLTQEDREIINYHITATMNMLESLKFPKRMRNVGKYAGAHHERVDGSGYPRGLQYDNIPIQARLMAVADVFEALTAKDRPYKQPIPLSEALRILVALKDDQKLDAAVVDLFIREKVYMRYAERYLDPEQIDIDLMSEFQGYHPE